MLGLRRRPVGRWVACFGVVYVLLVASCSPSAVEISSHPSPVPPDQAGSSSSSSELRSELGSLWRQRAFLMSQVLAGRGGAEASGALITNSIEIARTLLPAFGATQANIAESHLVQNSDLLGAYLAELTESTRPGAPAPEGLSESGKNRERVEADVEKVSDFLWLLTSAPRMVLRSLMNEQIRLASEAQFGRSIGLGAEIGDVLASAYHRREPDVYPASPETPAATARSRQESYNDSIIYGAYISGDVTDLRDLRLVATCGSDSPGGSQVGDARERSGNAGDPEGPIHENLLSSLHYRAQGDYNQALSELAKAIATSRELEELVC